MLHQLTSTPNNVADIRDVLSMDSWFIPFDLTDSERDRCTIHAFGDPFDIAEHIVSKGADAVVSINTINTITTAPVDELLDKIEELEASDATTFVFHSTRCGTATICADHLLAIRRGLRDVQITIDVQDDITPDIAELDAAIRMFLRCPGPTTSKRAKDAFRLLESWWLIAPTRAGGVFVFDKDLRMFGLDRLLRTMPVFSDPALALKALTRFEKIHAPDESVQLIKVPRSDWSECFTEIHRNIKVEMLVFEDVFTPFMFPIAEVTNPAK